MEYRTRHSVDGQIIQCEARIALVTGYMTHEVNGVNAMNFMHRDDVRWVIIALRESKCPRFVRISIVLKPAEKLISTPHLTDRYTLL